MASCKFKASPSIYLFKKWNLIQTWELKNIPLTNLAMQMMVRVKGLGIDGFICSCIHCKRNTFKLKAKSGKEDHLSTGLVGSNWKIINGYFRQKTWIDFQSNGIFIITKVGNFIWYHKNSEKNLARHSKCLSKL